MEVLKIGMLGIAGVMFAIQFKTSKQEYGMYIGFAVCLLIFSLVVSGMTSLLGSMESLKR